MVATDSSRSSVRTRYAAPQPGPPPRLSVAVAGLVGFGGCVVSFDPWRLWLLCGYFATTFLSAPLRRGAGPVGRSRGFGAAVDRLVGVRDGCVQGFGGDVTRRSRPPACGVARRRRPRPRAPVESPGAVAPSRRPLVVCAVPGAHRPPSRRRPPALEGVRVAARGTRGSVERSPARTATGSGSTPMTVLPIRRRP